MGSSSILNLDIPRKPVAGPREDHHLDIILRVHPAETGHSVPVHEEAVSPTRNMEGPVAKYSNPRLGEQCLRMTRGRYQAYYRGRFTLVREPTGSRGVLTTHGRWRDFLLYLELDLVRKSVPTDSPAALNSKNEEMTTRPSGCA